MTDNNEVKQITFSCNLDISEQDIYDRIRTMVTDSEAEEEYRKLFAKSPVPVVNHGFGLYKKSGTYATCPECNSDVSYRYKGYRPNYCMMCGQKLDWDKFDENVRFLEDIEERKAKSE